jgi:Flp pilus assembly protein TadG
MDAHGVRRRRLARFGADQGGAAAIEYALALPVLLTMLLGGIWVSLLMLTANSLDYSVQTAARCAAVDERLCGDTAAVRSYAARIYGGPTASPVFEATTAGCGHKVTGRATFDLNILPGLGPVPITTSACHP